MKIKLFLAAIVAVVMVGFNANAQVKIGYTNVDVILGQLPETKTVEAELKTKKDQYDALYKQKVTEFQTKLQAYEKGAATMSDVIKADKEKELQTSQASIEEFQKNAQDDLQKKQNQLLAPILQKIQTGIDAVAKEAAYTHVFNIDAGQGTTPILLYATEESNITNLVLKKLGVEPAKAAPAAAAPTTPATTAPKK
ncbi:MAG: OmpH family outer membrane protein [Bacteroidota bacterium]